MAKHSQRLVSLGETDAYVAAMERAQAKFQGLHVSFSVLELDTAPNLQKIQTALQELLRRHPMLVAELTRPFPWTKIWFQTTAQQAREIAFQTWEDREVREIIGEIASGKIPLAPQGHCHLRVDLARQHGKYGLIFAWRHLILDGVGAEWLVREFAALCADPKTASVAPSFTAPQGSPLANKQARWAACQPMLSRLMDIMKLGIHSLAGPKQRRAAAVFDVFTLDVATSAQLLANATAVAGPLLHTWFFLACAIRAHDAIWRKFRLGPPPQYAVALPMQQRPKGLPGPIFRNNVAAMYFVITPEQALSVAAMVPELFRQHQQALRRKLPESFKEMQHWMQVLPSWLYSKFLKFQMKGETTALQHSFTGTFVSGVENIADARITNGFHVPLIYAPPGSGLFVSEKYGQFTITTAWRDGVLSQTEAQALRDAFQEALLGKEETSS